MADMICHLVYGFLMSILNIFQTLIVKILRSPVLRGEWDGGSETARKLRGIGRKKLKKRTCYVKYSEQKT